MQNASKILITGGSGVLGSSLKNRLQESGYANVASPKSIEYDLRDRAQVDTLFETLKPEYLFHLAARVYGLGGNQAFKQEAYYDNILINTHVIDAAKKFGIKKIVAMGTVAAYPYPPVALPMTESTFLQGLPHKVEAGYATAKRAMLVHLQICRESGGPDFTYAISTNLYGENDKFDIKYGHVIPSLVRKFSEAMDSGQEVEVWGDGSDTRDFLYAGDAANGLILSMRNGEGMFNLASGMVHSIREVVDILSELSGVKGIKWNTSAPKGEEQRAYDVSRLKAMGFTHTVSLKEGLRRTFEWYRENKTSQ